ncbi:MAG: tyrosine-type recombinase/integrase [Oscillospiraceae bacterium]|nr:tyrosine-type recombinase/integrase [Oscillospiraceae bacterium]
MASSKKSAAGCGNIRKKVVKKNGKEYPYWEARYTVGYDHGTGKQIQKSITGKTQKEVAQKLKELTAALDAGTYIAPNKTTVGQWLDTWQAEYLGAVKLSTVSSYQATIKNHIKPGLGAIKLESLTTQDIQEFYNSRLKCDEKRESLSPKTVKNIHGVLHKALHQAMLNGLIRSNPSDACVLPKAIKKKVKPLNEEQIAALLKALKGHKYENLILTALFTGLREGEVCGLKWDCVNLESGAILVDKQLQSIRKSVRGDRDKYALVPTKNGKERYLTVAPFVVELLKKEKAKQDSNRKLFEGGYEDTGLVFTDEIGRRITPQAAYRAFKLVVTELGFETARFHDLRHSFAVASLRSGDDVKTVQENLGHATSAFTLDVYGHVTEQMKVESANRMEAFIQSVSA